LQKPFCFDRSEANVEIIAGEEMNQQNLFETNHYGDVARRTDPESSQIAAAEIRPKLGTFQNLFVDRALAWFERTDTWPTANEVAQGDESIRKRAKECVRKGYLQLGPLKRCSVTGKLAQTYTKPV
jgi:hypothetical protein